MAADRGDGLSEGYGVRRDGAKEPTGPPEDDEDDHKAPERTSNKLATARDINRYEAAHEAFVISYAAGNRHVWRWTTVVESTAVHGTVLGLVCCFLEFSV